MAIEALLPVEFITPAGIANGLLVEASVFAARYTHDTLRSLWEILSSVLEIVGFGRSTARAARTTDLGAIGPI